MSPAMPCFDKAQHWAVVADCGSPKSEDVAGEVKFAVMPGLVPGIHLSRLLRCVLIAGYRGPAPV